MGFDGALDALVCATVAYLFHHEPATLLRLRHEVAGKTGRGPFYVLTPTQARTTTASRLYVPGRLESKLLNTASSTRTMR